MPSDVSKVRGFREQVGPDVLKKTDIFNTLALPRRLAHPIFHPNIPDSRRGADESP